MKSSHNDLNGLFAHVNAFVTPEHDSDSAIAILAVFSTQTVKIEFEMSIFEPNFFQFIHGFFLSIDRAPNALPRDTQ